MEKQERGREGPGATGQQRIQLAVVDRGQETKLNQQFEFLYHNHPLFSITLLTSVRGTLGYSFVRMSPKPISALALPRSTLLALSQAGYETTDELALSTPESLARGKSVCPTVGKGTTDF